MKADAFGMHFSMKYKIMKMKKLHYLFLLTFFAGSPVAMAQRQFSDAEVTYSVKVEPADGSSSPVSSALSDGTLTYNFKNYLFRSQMNIGHSIYTHIHNSRANSAVVLIDVAAGKYLIKMNQSQLNKEDQRFAGLRFTDGNQTMKIAGYACKMATGKLANGSTFIVYYTPDLMPENKDYSDRFKGLKGLPLKFVMTTRNNMKMTMTATQVTLAPQSGALFITPTSGYRLLTYEELQSMRDNH